MRAAIHRRVEAGATALFLYAAGIVDGETASLDNMEQLLGMRVRVDGPGVLAATIDDAVAREHGIGPEARQIGNPKTEHFRYVIDDPCAAPLAHYADGAVAAATITRGKGRIILSAVPTASPALYQLAARLAGVHLYSETDDALYASGEFLMIHTRQAGTKRLRLPRVAPQVTEIFTGEVLATNVDEVILHVPPKTTLVLHVGGK